MRSTQMIFGYLDAGTGSLLLQAILGGAAGLVVAWKAWKARLLGRKAIKETNEAETPSEETALTSES